jgi:tetratricopeptide (TPR) repeat protein
LPRSRFFKIRLILYLGWALFIGSFTTNAQYQHLLNRPYAQRAEDIKQIYIRVYESKSANQALGIIDSLKAFAKQSGDNELKLEARLLRTFYQSKHNAEHQKVIADFEAIIGEANQQKVAQIAARTLDVLGQYYWNEVKNYELAFEKYIALSNVLEKIPDEVYPDKMASLRSIGYAYYYFGDYREAIYYFQKASAITITEFNRPIYFDVVNSLGLCYQKLGNLDSADTYFQQVVEGRRLSPDQVWQHIAKGNLGYSQFLRRKFDEAVPLLQADIKGAIRISDWGLAAGSLIPLATIYLEKGDLANATAVTRQAEDFVRRAGQYSRYQHLYPLLAKLYATKGQPLLAARYIDSINIVKDSLARQFNALQLLRAHQKIELQQQKALQENLAYQKRLKIIERNSLLVIVLLLISLLLYVYMTTRRKLRQEQALKALQLQEKEKELQRAAEQLLEFKQSVQEKNNLIEKLEQQFGASGYDAILDELRQRTILTNHDWEKFRSLFEQVHSGFLERLRVRFPDLTPAETRFMVLSRLRFSNKEMAAALGVSPQSVRTIWYRIRKKHNFPEEAGQEELVGSI